MDAHPCDHVTPLLPTLSRYAASAPRTTLLEPDDLYQDMAVHLLELDRNRSAQPMNDAYRKRAAWFARSASLKRESVRTRHASPPSPDDTGTEVYMVDEAPTPEEALLEAENRAELAALLPKLAAVIASLEPTNQRIVKLILAGAGRGDLSRATGLSRSNLSKRKISIRRAFVQAGIHPL